MNVDRHLVIGAFQPFGLKTVNQADLVARRLAEMREGGELQVPEDVKVDVVQLETSPSSVEQFVRTARDLKADHVLMLGENGLGVHVEARAFDRRSPSSLAITSLKALLPHPGKEESLASPAPVADMARAGGARLSQDAGRYYCNYSYHCALAAGLNAVFVHVPAGLYGFGRDAEGAAHSVNKMLGTWYQETSTSSLLMTEHAPG